MREGVVYINNRVSGILTEKSPSEYIFRYDDAYFADKEAPEISLSLPKKQQEYRSDYLFSFFSNMLSEGHNRTVQARLHGVDRDDDFGILLATACDDTPGAITIKPLVHDSI